jgi:hypothetical protein
LTSFLIFNERGGAALCIALYFRRCKLRRHLHFSKNKSGFWMA